MKVLLVDDEKKFVNMLAKRLKLRGISTTVTTSGEDALIWAKLKKHDVALLDIKMPGISGMELRHELSAIQKNMKFVFVTGHGCLNMNDSSFNSNDIFLPKPLDIDTLIETIKKITAGKN